MVDDINTQTEKVLEPIQLYDARGPQPLADERNNQFLQELFDKKTIDPIANSAYDVKSVVQSKKDWLSTHGLYTSDLSTWQDSDKALYKKMYEDVIKTSPRLSEKNKAIYMSQPWNTSDGVLTVLHELRHKAFDENPVLSRVIKKKQEVMLKKYGKTIGGKYEEILTRFMDVKYHDDEKAKEWLRTKFTANLYDKNESFQHGIYEDIEQIEDILRLQQEEE